MAWSIAQTADLRQSVVSASFAITFGATPTIANRLYFVLVNNNNTSVTAPVGLTVLDSSIAATCSVRTYFRDVQSGDGKTWTFTIGTAALGGLIAYEVASGGPVIGINAHAVTTGTASFPADASVTTTNAGELIVAGGIALGTTGTTTWTAGAGYTQDFDNSEPFNTAADIGQHQTQVSAGVIATGLVTAGSGWSIGTGFGAQFIVAFSPLTIVLMNPVDYILQRIGTSGQNIGAGGGVAFDLPSLTIQVGLKRRLYIVSPAALTSIIAVNPSVGTATVTDLGSITGDAIPQHYGYVEFTGVANTLGGAAFSVFDANGNQMNITTVVDTALTTSPSELTFSTPSSAAQTSAVSGGRTPYTVASSDTGVATVSVSGSTVTVTPVALGACTITVTDTSSGFTSGGNLYGWADNISTTIAVAVGPGGALSRAVVAHLGELI